MILYRLQDSKKIDIETTHKKINIKIKEKDRCSGDGTSTIRSRIFALGVVCEDGWS